MSSAAVKRDSFGRVIAIINGKGGLGKTTLCSNVGGLMARNGYKVLLVDIDPQGNLGLDLGYADTDQDDLGKGLSAALQGLVSDVRVVRGVREGLDVIVGGSALHGAAAALAAPSRGIDPRDALANVLEPLVDEYDLILIDCPPGNESLQTTAIGAARWVVAPSRVDEGSGRGLKELSERVEGVVSVNPKIDLLGIVLFDIEKSATRVDAQAREMVTEILGSGDKLFTSSIRHSVSVAQQTRKFGKLVHELEEHAQSQPEWWQQLRDGNPAGERVTRTAGNVADDLYAFTAELMERLVAHEAAEE
jgi:cellulose biosynthesis protein BcsQ